MFAGLIHSFTGPCFSQDPVKLEVAGIFQDNMVVQQGETLNILGKGAINSLVEVNVSM